MKLFTPPDTPSWLDPLLRRITQGLREPWDSPLRLKSLATAELPLAADYPGGIVYDSTTTGLKLSDGATWSAVGSGGGGGGTGDSNIDGGDATSSAPVSILNGGSAA